MLVDEAEAVPVRPRLESSVIDSGAGAIEADVGQDFGVGRVAEHGLDALLLQLGGVGHVLLDDQKGQIEALQQAADVAADTAIADDDDVV